MKKYIRSWIIRFLDLRVEIPQWLWCPCDSCDYKRVSQTSHRKRPGVEIHNESHDVTYASAENCKKTEAKWQ